MELNEADIESKNVLCLIWTRSNYDSLQAILRITMATLESLGYCVETFVLGAEFDLAKLLELIRSRSWRFAYGMSGVGINIQVQVGNPRLQPPQNIWQAARIPYFDWKCDHPCHNFPVHTVSSRYLMHGYVFPDHAQFSVEHLNTSGMVYPLHIGLPDPNVFPQIDLPLRARNGRFLFTKSGGDPDQRRSKWSRFPKIISKILNLAADKIALESLPSVRYVDVINEIGIENGLIVASTSALLFELLQELEMHERSRRATLIVESLLDFPIDVYGKDWEHVNFEGKNALRHETALPFETTLDLMPKYLGCLNSNPLVERSVHDRCFFSIACGTPSISDRNAFSIATMSKLTDFNFEHSKESIRGSVERVLDAPDAAIAATIATRESLEDQYSMRRTMETMILLTSNYFALHNFNVTTLPADVSTR